MPANIHALRQACLQLLEAEYQLECKRHKHQTENYTAVQDVDFDRDKHLRSLRRTGVYTLVALIVYIVMIAAGMGGVIRDAAFVALIVTGIPTLLALVRLVLTIPQRGKAHADEKRMAKKWSSFDAVEDACTRQRLQLAASVPLQEGKRFMHIPTLGTIKDYPSYNFDHLRLGSRINFVAKDGKSFVEGLQDMQPCAASAVHALLASSELVSFHCDQDYLTSHPAEEYLWGSIFSFQHTAPLKSHTTEYDQIDVNATMANFNSAYDRAERSASPSGRTHEESYYAGKMSFGDYRAAEDYKARQMEKERKALEMHNAQNTHTTFYYDEVTQHVHTAGFVITTRSGRLIYAGYFTAGQDFMRFTYCLPKHVRTQSGGGLPEADARALQGEILSFEQPREFPDVNQRLVMAYVLQRFGKQMQPFDPMQIIPAGMEDNDFRYWIELQYLHSRTAH